MEKSKATEKNPIIQSHDHSSLSDLSNPINKNFGTNQNKISKNNLNQNLRHIHSTTQTPKVSPYSVMLESTDHGLQRYKS